jgi:hypothetical protein
MSNRGRLAPVVLAVGLCVLAGVAWFFLRGTTLISFSSTDAGTYTVPPLTQEYSNATYRFSLSVPEDFTTQEFTEEGKEGQTIVLQDAQGNGIQVVITPAAQDVPDLDENRLQQDNPAMQILHPEKVEIGTGRMGVAFKSDNVAFEGDSREVWFYLRGNLYQITTYARLDPLLQAVFGTWKFI